MEAARSDPLRASVAVPHSHDEYRRRSCIRSRPKEGGAMRELYSHRHYAAA